MIGQKILQPASIFALDFTFEAENAIAKLEVPEMTPGYLNAIKVWTLESQAFGCEQKAIEFGTQEILDRLKAGSL